MGAVARDGPETAADLDHRIRGIFLEALNVSVDSTDTDLIETGVLDSLALVELLLRLEEEFDVKVDVGELDVEDFRTVGSIGSFVTRLRTGEGGR
jgi:methoxymalonate biosynthesis acyl carrier protein